MSGSSLRHASRRQVVGAGAALGAVALAGVAKRVIGDVASQPGEPDGQLTLSDHESPGMQTLELPVSPQVTPVGAGHWRSRKLATSTFTMVGFIWPDAAQGEPDVRFRVRDTTRWGAWQRLPVQEDGPDRGSREDRGHRGTQVTWVGRCTGLQYDVRGALPADMKLVLLHPLPRHADRSAGRLTLQGFDPAPLKPLIHTRAEWGADESWVGGPPSYCPDAKQFHIHHTATSNGYAPQDVPSMIRGMYRYHTKSLGWNDIAYNFLVDAYGQIWEGRAGGIDAFVMGAHTLGFNRESVGCATIGNYSTAQPTPALLDAVTSLAAWKVALFGGKPLGSVAVTSSGSDRFKAGRTVTLPVIDGHRDTNDTGCPGDFLYAQIPSIRHRVAQRIRAAWAAQHPLAVTSAPAVRGTAMFGARLTVSSGRYAPAATSTSVQWLRDGAPIPGATTRSYTCGAEDVGHTLGVAVVATGPRGRSATTNLTVGIVLVQPTLTFRAKAGRGSRVAVKVKVHSPAGYPTAPGGTVRIRVKHVHQDVPLVNGAAKAVFEDVPSGHVSVSAVYPAQGWFAKAKPQRHLSVSVGTAR